MRWPWYQCAGVVVRVVVKAELLTLIKDLRSMCYFNWKTGELRDQCRHTGVQLPLFAFKPAQEQDRYGRCLRHQLALAIAQHALGENQRLGS